MRPNFTRSRLVRLLCHPAEPPAQASRQDVAERLAGWVSAFEAMAVHSAHQAIQAVPASAADVASPRRLAALEERLQQVRSGVVSLVSGNSGNSATGPQRAPGQRGGPSRGAPEPMLEADATAARFRQRHADHQRQLETQVAALRNEARQALSRSSARLRQLAMLDAVMEQTLAAREQKLMATVPQLLELRFVQLRRDQLTPTSAMNGTSNDALNGAQDAGTAPAAARWLDVFTREWQAVLQAELDVRLQPVIAMIEALSSESKKYP